MLSNSGPSTHAEILNRHPYFAYAVVLIASLTLVFYSGGDGEMSVPAIEVGQPWSAMLSDYLGKEAMIEPDPSGLQLGDWTFSGVGCSVLVISGLINVAILYGAARLSQKPE